MSSVKMILLRLLNGFSHPFPVGFLWFFEVLNFKLIVSELRRLLLRIILANFDSWSRQICC